jgi:hypothetical protein
MNRAALLCVLLCVLGACQSDSSASSGGTSVAPTSTRADDLACMEEGGNEVGQTPRPVLHVGDQTFTAHYAFGDRTPCPWLVEEGAVTTLAALDGVGVEEVDVEVVPGAQVTVSVEAWSDRITVDFLGWSELGSSEKEGRLTPTEVEPGVWKVDAPPEPGDYVLSLRLLWEYGQDTWGWRIKVIN